MISQEQFKKELELIIANAIREDVGDGDHTSLSCIPSDAHGKAKLLVKDNGIIAGVAFAKMIFDYVDSDLHVETFIQDGEKVNLGDVVFHVSGKSQSILKAERLVLNSMQRMSAIATKTRSFADLLEGTHTKVLDTRKTTPGIRVIEKWAVTIGGGENHRFALYDMIMIKDNHIDFAGGIAKAIQKTKKYLIENNNSVYFLQSPIPKDEKETRKILTDKIHDFLDSIPHLQEIDELSKVMMKSNDLVNKLFNKLLNS